MPHPLAPMRCTLVDAAFDSPNWIFEPKIDGLQVLARFDGRDIALLSRSNKPQESRFPEIVAGLRRPLQYPATIDGEVVFLLKPERQRFVELIPRGEIGHRAFDLLAPPTG